ncbi:hypothetical protein FIBSPDRAFT_594037 [Athelia psychrophila]|uniref:Stealth protein CR3 conserved region 3 domain-containing protein n=1 Tax=Athelia psychrophila TaxID=1759441 RepID=A0A166GZW7_9AGAM|nr:hypothetical protein FIBSPDRAFT_594037 [Fibularhizoctonia sp. CBS 109695]
MKALPAESIAGLHVVTTDLPMSSEDVGTRYGQVPEWLNRTHAEDGSCAPAVHMHHHWDLFKMRTHAGQSTAGNVTEEGEARAEAWRERVLPSFNSIGIESQLVSLAPQLSNTILYFNDDFFVTRPLALTDFTSPLFGTVFRLQSSLLVAASASGAADKEGEWPSLNYANQLLDARFGVRRRPYVQHFVKTYEKEILAEIAQIWPGELTESAEVRFRDGPAVGLAFLATHFVVERHREALLWSFLIARADSDASRAYSPAERRAVLAELTPAAENAKYRKHPTSNSNPLRPQILVPKPRRAPLYAPHAALVRAGLPTPRATAYTFSAHAGGYAYARLGGHTKWQNGEPVWVEPGKGQRWVPDRNWPVYDYDEDDESGDADGEEGAAEKDEGKQEEMEKEMDIECALDVVECFGEEWVAPADGDGDVLVEEVFRRVAFERPRCGDCIIASLVGQSGRRGLSAFLPPPPAEEDARGKIHIPLSVEKTWEKAAYADDLGGDRSRARAVSLLQRYSYIIGACAIGVALPPSKTHI